MNIELSKFKKNIIAWYPIEKTSKVLDINNDEIILSELKKMSNNVISCNYENYIDYSSNEKYDYIVLIGIFEKLNNQEKIMKILEFSKEFIKDNGKILLALSNKFGMEYWTGELFNDETKSFKSIISSKENILGYANLKNIFENMNLKYKFYYPFPNYNITNVIYTDEFLPDNDSIDARMIGFSANSEFLNFSERDAFKEIIKTDEKMFPFFANSYFVEVSKDEKYLEKIKYVGFGVTRKEEFSIKTVIQQSKVIKTENFENSKTHIEKIRKNIDILNNLKINTVDEYKDGKIESKFLENVISYDKYLLNILDTQGVEKVIDEIKKYEKEILNKFENIDKPDKTIFEKYDIDVPAEIKEKMHFIKNGLYDLIFQNCLVKENTIYVYDQEWYEENLPVEFILYRALFYFTELKNRENIDEIYSKFNLTEYIKIFELLESKLQDEIIDNKIWDLHKAAIRDVGRLRGLLDEYKEYIGRLENLLHNEEKVHRKDVDELTNLILKKDEELVDYANQLRCISNSISWKITKPLRAVVRILKSLKEKFFSNNKNSK